MLRTTPFILFITLILFPLLVAGKTLNPTDTATHSNSTIKQKNLSPGLKKGAFAQAYFEKGKACFYKENFGTAYEHFQQYIAAIEKQNNPDQLIFAYRCVGDIYKDKMVFDVALDYYLKALHLSKAEDNKVTGDIYTAIGGIYYDQEYFERSQDFYQKSLEIYQKCNARQDLAAAYNNLGEMFRFQGNSDSALSYYQEAVKINRAFNNRYYLAINYNNIGQVYLNQKKYKEAYTNLIASQNLLASDSLLDLLAASYSSIANYYLQTNDYKKAARNYLKTLEFKLDDYPKHEIIKKDAYYGLSNAYNGLGDMHNAFKYYQKYTELKDIVFNSEKHKTIFEVQTRYETKQKENEITYLQEKAKRDNQEKQKQRTNLIIVISLLALIVLLLIYSYLLSNNTLKQKTQLFEQTNRLNQLEIENKAIENKRLIVENRELEAREEINRLNQEKLQTELEHKQRELSTTALHVIGKNEMLDTLKCAMQKLIKDHQKAPQQALEGLIGEIDNNIHLDKDWDAFKLHFEKVHPGFFTRLKERYTELTVDELKLCAYLRINLSSKEIAQILNITQAAINKRRNRLRKKLELQASDDLFHFMNSI